jgi:hypothetical protein
MRPAMRETPAPERAFATAADGSAADRLPALSVARTGAHFQHSLGLRAEPPFEADICAGTRRRSKTQVA